MDIADFANDLMEKDRAQAVATVARPVGRSAHFCMDCDDRIPEARRQAYPGCQRCVECQSDVERAR
jgi:phage/conjugal plasmid C-4 type zinc finger TraR family protein